MSPKVFYLLMVKGKCQASMSTWEIHDLEVSLDLTSGSVMVAHCTFKAGNSGYCNHIMCLLLELAHYSLQELDSVPEDAACCYEKLSRDSEHSLIC